MDVFASALEGAAQIRDQFTGWQHIRLCLIALSTEECVSFHMSSNRVACNSGKYHCRRALRTRRGRRGIIYFHSYNGLTHWGSFQKTGLIYLSAVEISVKTALVFAPTPVRTGMMVTAIPVAIKPYSMAVAARSSLRKEITWRIHFPVFKNTIIRHTRPAVPASC
jgi:hypothetical protein